MFAHDSRQKVAAHCATEIAGLGDFELSSFRKKLFFVYEILPLTSFSMYSFAFGLQNAYKKFWLFEDQLKLMQIMKR